MQIEDVQTLASLGKGLWEGSDVSQALTLETISAVSLLNLSPEQALEKGAQALLRRAKRESAASGLSSEERLVLIGLHLGKWSYGRLSRVLGISPNQVEELAWSARLEVASGRIYPAGPSSSTSSCPHYLPARPWTQKFLDDEMKGQEKFNTQKHLVDCDSCQRFLKRSREFYFIVDQRVRQWKTSTEEATHLIPVIQEGAKILQPTSRKFTESLILFLRRPGMGVLFLIWLALVLKMIWNLVR